MPGRLNASSTIGGTTDAPQVSADFKIAQGGFRQFKYDSLNGTVDYRGKTITLNTRLQQNPTTWLEAKGTVPTSALNGTGGAESIDVHVDSSPVDLGLVQGFTNALTNVTGTFEAHVNVTGTAADPKPAGAITIQNGAFKVEPTGVAYTAFDGRIDLQPDRVHIDQIRVLDNQQKPLTISGDLAIQERQVGGVSIAVKTDDFKVIDNKVGNVRINTNLQLTGQLTAPRIEGDLGIATGQINLDPILAQTGDSAYATKPDRVRHRNRRCERTGGGTERVRRAADGRARHRAG